MLKESGLHGVAGALSNELLEQRKNFWLGKKADGSRLAVSQQYSHSLLIMRWEGTVGLVDVLARDDARGLRIGYEPAMTPALQPLLLTTNATMALSFAHYVTTRRRIEEGDGICAHGTTVWVASTEENECAALSFEWTELAPGVLCVANMLAVASNIYPMG